MGYVFAARCIAGNLNKCDFCEDLIVRKLWISLDTPAKDFPFELMKLAVELIDITLWKCNTCVHV